MQCKFLVDADTHIELLPESERSKVLFRIERHRNTGIPRRSDYFPKGTVLDHPDAYKFVNFGMAEAVDEECRKACEPMTDADRAVLVKQYAAVAMGINDRDDIQLYVDGVILGYEKVGDNWAYIAGPNWDAWQKKNAAAKPKNDDEDI